MKRFLLLLPIALAFASAGCRGNDFQSALHPAGEDAREIAWLWWVMFWLYGAVFLVTIGLLGAAIFRKRTEGGEEPAAPGGPLKFVVIAGIVVPTIILLAVLVISMRVGASLRAPETEFTIEITGKLWWWDVRYPDQGIVTANELRIPEGVPVRLDLLSGDVIHSFWVPNLHGKMDMMPDHMNRFWLRADRPGTYRGICAEFCGNQHALMGIDVIVLPRAEFDAWIAEKSALPRDVPASRGRELFFETGCAACHAIGGTEAVSTAGPDLTLLADRPTLGASSFPNSRENLAKWITNPQSMKPGNLMPATDMPPEDLEALVDFLETLR